MSIEIKVHGLKEIEAKLKKIKDPKAFKSAIAVLGQVVTSQTVERFEEEVDPAGQKWKALKKPREGGLTLNQTGQLKRISYQLFDHGVKIGPTVEYGKFHQFGTKHMEARPFLGINEENYNEIEEVLTAQLRRHYGS